MRFDPLANYSESHGADPDLAALPAQETGSPLKMAIALVVIGFVAGGALWIVSEGLPGGHQASADGRGSTGLSESIIQYAESVVGSKAAAKAQPLPNVASSQLPTSGAQRKSRQDFAEARAAMGMGRDQEAIEHLKKAIRHDPAYADAHYRLGLMYVKHGDHAAARREQAYLKSLDVDDLANLLGHLVDN